MLFSGIRVPVLSGKGYDRVKVKGGSLCLYYRVEPKMVNGIRTYKKKNLGKIITDENGSEFLMPNENYYEHMSLPLPDVDESSVLRPGRARSEQTMSRQRQQILMPKFSASSIREGLAASGLTVAALQAAHDSGLINRIYRAFGRQQGNLALSAAVFTFTPMSGGLAVFEEFALINQALMEDGFSRKAVEDLLSTAGSLSCPELFMTAFSANELEARWEVLCIDGQERTAVVCLCSNHSPLMFASGPKDISFDDLYEQALARAGVNYKPATFVMDAAEGDSFAEFSKLFPTYKSHRCMRFDPYAEPEVFEFLARWSGSGFYDSICKVTPCDVIRMHREQYSRQDLVLYMHKQHSARRAVNEQLEMGRSMTGLYKGKESEAVSYRLAACGCSAVATSGSRMESDEIFELFENKDRAVEQMTKCSERLMQDLRIPVDQNVRTGVLILSFIAVHILNSMRVSMSDAMDRQMLSFDAALQHLNSLSFKRSGTTWSSDNAISPLKAELLESLGISCPQS